MVTKADTAAYGRDVKNTIALDYRLNCYMLFMDVHRRRGFLIYNRPIIVRDLRTRGFRKVIGDGSY